MSTTEFEIIEETVNPYGSPELHLSTALGKLVAVIHDPEHVYIHTPREGRRDEYLTINRVPHSAAYHFEKKEGRWSAGYGCHDLSRADWIEKRLSSSHPSNAAREKARDIIHPIPAILEEFRAELFGDAKRASIIRAREALEKQVRKLQEEIEEKHEEIRLLNVKMGAAN